MPRSRSRSGSLDSLGRRRRRDASSSSRRRRRSVSVSRSRSRSASRGRRRNHRSRSRSRNVERRRRRRSYSRSRSPVIQFYQHRSTSRSTSRRASETKRVEELKVEPKETPNAMSQLSEEEQMRLLLGFGNFDSTKGKVVEENLKGAAVGTARRDTKREYRQYMNRRGGFNRPLDKA